MCRMRPSKVPQAEVEGVPEVVWIICFFFFFNFYEHCALRSNLSRGLANVISSRGYTRTRVPPVRLLMFF